MQTNVFFRLRGPNIIGTAFFALTALILNIHQGNNFDLIKVILIILSMVFFNIYIWVSNDYYDAPYDIEHDKKSKRNVFCENPDNRDYKIGLAVMWFSLIAGLVSGFLANFTSFLFAVGGMLLAYLYTSPVFRAKGRPILDWVFHVIWFQITFLPLYLYIYGFDVIWGVETKHIQFYAIFIYISLISLLGQINHQIPDYSIDIQTNQRTTVVVVGIETTLKLRYGIYFIISVTVIILCLLNGAILALLMMIIYTLYYLKTNKEKAESAPTVWILFFLLDYIFLSPFLVGVIPFL